MSISRAPTRPPLELHDLYPDRPPLPDVREVDSDTVWALWSSLCAEQDAVFADTVPASVPMPLPPGDPRSGVTVPSPLSSHPLAAQAAARAAAARVVALGEVMTEARRNGRLCPRPAPWQQLYEMLPGRTQGPAGWQPPPPLTGGAWASTPALAKRMCLRDHVEWAASHGCLEAVQAFLKGLPEDQWHHMGE